MHPASVALLEISGSESHSSEATKGGNGLLICNEPINQPPIEQMFFERQLHRSFLLSAADTMEAKLPSISVVMDVSNFVAGIELEAREEGSVMVNTYESGQG